RNETLFVYANLHGKAEDKGDGPKQGQALQIKGQELSRQTLRGWLAQKEAFLTVLITDSCFQSSRRGDAPPPDDFGIGVKPETGEEAEKPEERFVLPYDLSPAILTDLLINHKGFVDINSCKSGELAVTDVFTTSFVTLVSGRRTAAGEPILTGGETPWPQ